MSELRWVPPPPPEALRRALRPALGQLGRPLRVLAEDVSGVAGGIDLVAVDPAGRVVAVLVAPSADLALELVARGLAERNALAPRLADWCKLAPELGLEPDAGVGLLLLAADFDAAARAAVAGDDSIALARLRFVALGGEAPRALLESLAPEAFGAGSAGPARLSVFRTGLGEADLQPVPTPAA